VNLKDRPGTTLKYDFFLEGTQELPISNSPQPAFKNYFADNMQGEIKKRLAIGFELSNRFWYLLKI
jgi:hypothetical protein